MPGPPYPREFGSRTPHRCQNPQVFQVLVPPLHPRGCLRRFTCLHLVQTSYPHKEEKAQNSLGAVERGWQHCLLPYNCFLLSLTESSSYRSGGGKATGKQRAASWAALFSGSAPLLQQRTGAEVVLPLLPAGRSAIG